MRLSRAALAAGGMALLGSFAARAADLPFPSPAPSIQRSSYDWTGFYVGANVGAAITTNGYADSVGNSQFNDLTLNNTFFWSLHAGGQGVVGGIQGGYNYQVGSFVVGAQADLDFGHIGGAGSFTGTGALYGSTMTQTASEYLNGLGLLEARAGYAGFDRWLLYAEGGLALGSVDRAASLTGTSASWLSWSGSSSGIDAGYALGGGVEYALTDHIALTADCQYYNLGAKVTTTAPNAAVQALPSISGIAWMEKSMAAGTLARLGLNYKF
jgi:outer membrane immunogenic protein